MGTPSSHPFTGDGVSVKPSSVFGVDHPMQQISLVVEPPTPLKNSTNRQLGL